MSGSCALAGTILCHYQAFQGTRFILAAVEIVSQDSTI